MNEPKLEQMNKVLYKQFRVMRSEGKPIIEPMIIKKVLSLCDEMNITDKYTFLEDWLQNLKTSTCTTHKNGKLLYLVVQPNKGAVSKNYIQGSQFTIGSA